MTPKSMTPEDYCKGSLFVYALRNVTEVAARAAYHWIGRGERGENDRAVVEAMSGGLSSLPIAGRIVTGEGAEGASLATGRLFDNPGALRKFDIAVDPIEGTSYLARGMTNAMAVIGLAPEGTMFDPGPAFYMEKFVAPPVLTGKIDPASPIENKIKVLSANLDKEVSDLTIFVLEKPRHRELIERIHNTGARVAQYPAGDVAGAIMASVQGSGIDAMVGTGGTREGVISACAIRALGGVFYSRIDPQLATEKAQIAKSGIDLNKWMAIEDLVHSDETYFCATGITTGLLFEGVSHDASIETTQSLMIAGPGTVHQLLTTYHKQDTTNP